MVESHGLSRRLQLLAALSRAKALAEPSPMAWLGLAQTGSAWPGIWLWAGPGTSLETTKHRNNNNNNGNGEEENNENKDRKEPKWWNTFVIWAFGMFILFCLLITTNYLQIGYLTWNHNNKTMEGNLGQVEPQLDRERKSRRWGQQGDNKDKAILYKNRWDIC